MQLPPSGATRRLMRERWACTNGIDAN